MKVNETNMQAMQNQITNMKAELKNEFQAMMLQQNNKLENMLSNYFQMNKPPSLGPLPNNTVTNPKGDLKAITTRNGVSYDGPPIPPPFSSSPKVVEREPEAWPILVAMHSTDALLQYRGTISLPKLTPTQCFLSLRIVNYLDQPAHCRFSDNSESVNLTPISEPVITKSSPSFTPFKGGDFILEEIKAYLASDLVPPGINDTEFDLEGDILLIEEMLNNDPYSPLPLKDLKCEELKSIKSSINEPPELELKDLPSHLEYAFLEGTNKLPVIIAKNLKDEEKECLIKVLKSLKLAITWKLFDIKDSPWVSPMHCVPKEGRMTVVTNEDNELIPTKCMMAIFHDMIEETMEVFMDDFSVFGDSFSSCLSHLDKMLKRCEDTNLVLNWEKCHFMVKEGIVLGHKILKSRIEVDRAKVDVIAKLPPPTSVKGIRSFLGHAGFYRRFIQDFSKIAQPMTHLLEKGDHHFLDRMSRGI
ncbi:reverse transcriptase domain-containing protein [Tanacetum coccineum]